MNQVVLGYFDAGCTAEGAGAGAGAGDGVRFCARRSCSFFMVSRECMVTAPIGKPSTGRG